MRRFFIVGPQRSGTTLMRLVLECHSRIVCFDESNAYAILAGQIPADAPSSKDVLGFKIPNWTEQMLQPELRDHAHQVVAESFYDGEPLVFMLRDVRDTVASMVNLKVEGERSWLEVWGVPIVDAQIKHSARFRERFRDEIELLDSPLAYGALYWKFKTAAYFDYTERGLPVVGVRYEQLVAEPEAQLHRVTDCLGLEWEPALLDHTRHEHAQVAADGRTVGGTDPKHPISAESVGQWQECFTGGGVEELLAVAGDLNDRVVSLGELAERL